MNPNISWDMMMSIPNTFWSYGSLSGNDNLTWRNASELIKQHIAGMINPTSGLFLYQSKFNTHNASQKIQKMFRRWKGITGQDILSRVISTPEMLGSVLPTEICDYIARI